MIARSPQPGRSKTRLCPPCSPVQASELAAAALEDTLRAVADTPVERRVLVLDGGPVRWLPGGFEVIPQRGTGLGERLAAAFSDVGAPSLIIGMDTPQVTARLLRDGLDQLETPGVGAVLGPARDGGYWALGLRCIDARVFTGVPMSTSRTGEAQKERLEKLSLDTKLLPELRDVDFFEDARAVASDCPESVFSREFNRILTCLESGDQRTRGAPLSS